MADDPVFAERRTGLARALRDWAGASRARRVLVVLLQVVPLLLGAACVPAALDGSAAARGVVAVVAVAAVAYKVVDVVVGRRDERPRAAG